MAKLPLTPALRRDYDALFAACTLRPRYREQIDARVGTMIAHKPRYAALSATCGVPWTVIAVLHELECGQSFARHLHNGDPLARATTHVPKGRPPGTPPWTWEESAADALNLTGLARWHDWSIAGTLYQLECYNGTGYRRYHPTVPSPYLWSFSTHYTAGKYKADGQFSPTLISRQPGAAVLLHALSERGEAAFDNLGK